MNELIMNYLIYRIKRYPKENDYYCRNIRKIVRVYNGQRIKLNSQSRTRSTTERNRLHCNYSAIIDPRLPFLIASIKAIMPVPSLED